MTSLRERVNLLEQDLLAEPIRISAYHDLPFAIFQYPPEMEYRMRDELNRLGTRLENGGKGVRIISLAELMWEAIEKTRGLDYVVRTEKQFGFNMAQTTVNNFLSKLSPFPDMLMERIAELEPEQHIVFLTRAGALAPAIYRMSKLLDEMHGRTMVPIVLFYPGEKEDESELRFMGIEGREGISGYNYRVKIY
jgi:hypothetical protein